jgi:hypothetical protein
MIPKSDTCMVLILLVAWGISLLITLGLCRAAAMQAPTHAARVIPPAEIPATPWPPVPAYPLLPESTLG